MASVEENLGNLHISNGASAAGAPPPPPPPGMGMGMGQTYKEQRDKQIEEQMMANLPSKLLTTAAKADKKPFAYTPVGLSATDLKAPSSLRQEKLDAMAEGPGGHGGGGPRVPTNVRIFNGITPPAYDGPGSGRDSPAPYSQSPLTARRNSLTRSDSGSDAGGSRKPAPIQSRSFKILQWMTGADEDDDAILNSSPPAKTVQPDEMKFSGYNRSDTIPSRAYQTLERNVSESGVDESPNPFRPSESFRTQYSEEAGPNARYEGQTIPSKAFRTLQNMTGNQPDNSLHMRPPSPTMGRRSPAAHVNPALVQQHYQKDALAHIPPPSPQDFKYQGPQYSTYELPPRANFNYPPTASPVHTPHQPASQPQPRFSSSVSLIPGGGDHRAPQDYADQSSAYSPHNTFQPANRTPPSPSPFAGQQQQQQHYSQQFVPGPARNFQQAQPVMGGEHYAGAGRSDF